MNHIYIFLIVLFGFIAHKILFSITGIIIKFPIGNGNCFHLHHWVYMGIIILILEYISRKYLKPKSKQKITIINCFLFGYILAGLCDSSWKYFIEKC